MAGRGRRASTRGAYTIEDEALLLPDPVALDRSFVVEALLPSQPLHQLCAGFLARIIGAGVDIVSSELLPIELAEAAFGMAMKERWGRKWRHRRGDRRARRGASRQLAAAITSYDALVQSALPRYSVPLTSVGSGAVALMTDHGLRSYDAVHAATAITAGAEALVTTDVGFASVSAKLLTIYTDRSRIAACRRRRQR